MNAKEFAALRVGDKIVNASSGSHGEVVEVTEFGVRVRWSWVDRPTPDTAPTRSYGANTTAWMHWDKVEDTTEQT